MILLYRMMHWVVEIAIVLYIITTLILLYYQYCINLHKTVITSVIKAGNFTLIPGWNDYVNTILLPKML